MRELRVQAAVQYGRVSKRIQTGPAFPAYLVALLYRLYCRPTITSIQSKSSLFLFGLNLHISTVHNDLSMYYGNECEMCDREFGSQQAAIQHMDALDHWASRFECDTCDREFFTQRSADQHMDDKGHWEPQFGCETCDKRFRSQLYANQHMNALNHYKRHCCCDCAKTFQSENALRMVRSLYSR